MNKYAEKFKDPRWQKKRLQILERDGWKCRFCDGETETLNVHHLYYKRGADPWSYEDEALITYCDSCHSLWHDIRENIDNEIVILMRILFPFPNGTEPLLHLLEFMIMGLNNNDGSFFKLLSDSAMHAPDSFSKLIRFLEKSKNES